MSLFDFIRELRKGRPDIQKAARAMKIMGWVCLAGALWNFIFYFIVPFDKGPVTLPPEYPYVALIVLSILGLVFFRSARGIQEMAPWGKKTGQLALCLMLGVFIGLFYYFFPIRRGPFGSNDTSELFMLFIAIFLLQFGIPVYFGIRYLGRLPVKDGSSATYQYSTGSASMSMTRKLNTGESVTDIKYKDSPSPFGIFGTFAILIAVPMIIIFTAVKFVGEGVAAFLVPPFFIFIFLGPAVYNYVPSPFQANRILVASFTGGGGIFLFSGSWPFFRLLVYQDALEVRTMFHRFLIPYDMMEDLPEKLGFLSMGILIKSDLPGIPSHIRFYGFRSKKVLLAVNNTRNKYLG